MTTDLQGQRLPALQDSGAIALANAVNHVVGTVPALLVRPAGRQLLVLRADKGGWRVALGDRTGSMPAEEHPAAAVTDGSGAAHLAAGSGLALAGPAALTVRAYAADSVLSYWWL